MTVPAHLTAMPRVLGLQDLTTRSSLEVLCDQIRQLIRLRWLAVGVIVVGAVAGTQWFPVLATARPLWILSGVLLLCNGVYAAVYRHRRHWSESQARSFALIQIEADLLVLSAVLLVSGGVMNPFFLFYIFHVIVATIILPREGAFLVGLTTIASFGLLAANELHGGRLLGDYGWRLSSGRALWHNPVYVLAAFLAFGSTVLIAQHLTGMIMLRMTSKEWEAAQHSRVLRAIIHAMSEGVLFLDRAGTVTLCNEAAFRWRAGDGAWPAALEQAMQRVAGVADGGGPSETIEFHTESDPPRVIEARAYPVLGPDGEFWGRVLVGQDLTETRALMDTLKRRSEELAAANEDLRVSRIQMAEREKMVALGQMAAGIAHEIGNPLASLSSVAQWLERKSPGSDEKQKIRMIHSQVERISRILKRMLHLARPNTSDYRWVDVDEIVEATLSLVRFDRRMKQVEVLDERGPSLPHVWLNPQELEQVLLNVFINAMDAMEAHPTGDASAKRLHITRVCDGRTIELRIRDTGVGMPADVARRAFESFFTTKGVGRGTGLGLTISQNLMAEIDGSISLESQPGAGTTVTLRFPVRPKNELLNEDATPNKVSQDA